MAGRLAAEGRSIPFEADSVRLSAGYGDVAAFHGGRYPAGAVLGFKALTLVVDYNIFFNSNSLAYNDIVSGNYRRIGYPAARTCKRRFFLSGIPAVGGQHIMQPEEYRSRIFDDAHSVFAALEYIKHRVIYDNHIYIIREV